MGSSWKPGRLIMQHAETPRSYEIQDEGRKYLRNRRTLIKSAEDNLSSIDSPFASNSPTTGTREWPHSKEPLDKVSPSVEGPTATFPQPEELCSTDEDIEETTRTTSGVELFGSHCVSRTMFWGENHSLSIDVSSFEQLHEFASCYCCVTQ